MTTLRWIGRGLLWGLAVLVIGAVFGWLREHRIDATVFFTIDQRHPPMIIRPPRVDMDTETAAEYRI